MKQPHKNYLSITKTQWNACVILVLLIIAVLAAPYIYDHFHKDKPINFKAFNLATARLAQAGDTAYTDDANEGAPSRGDVKTAHSVMFAFNPNHLSVAKWQKLGLSDKQIAGIKHYEAKGGQFRTKADVKKMYTLTDADYSRLEPYINLPESSNQLGYDKPTAIIEINTADSAKLTQIKGIGPAFAMHIIHYRERLGGFYRKEQLKEIFGMDEDRYQFIKSQLTINAKKITKININNIDFDNLKRFPYLSYKQMNAIIEYRKQHGNYETFEEMRNVAILDESTLHKIKPYLTF
ncbi:hypothetical protein HH214_16595 [Mucilaginibacter robiniae]|uniref:Helix-hairpin-helix domain-containing protein n=1 Tax=Mucilaginibacter robiniae TaxID=2728022 RepID=A0A7L5E1Y6_9SPHI|nr:helix-hairpin-helix domain-containing protein [Mucilaginibacter robiniae]QJD97370.1 hypothetical protein HH214_16595 [Mucilaginibacter robiniae]